MWDFYKNEETNDETEEITENNGDEALNQQPCTDSEYAAEEPLNIEQQDDQVDDAEASEEEEDDTQCEIIGSQSIAVQHPLSQHAYHNYVSLYIKVTIFKV